MNKNNTKLKMFPRKIFIIVALTGVLTPHISAQDNPSLDPDSESDRDSRQFSFITTPFRRAASTTRELVRFIRDYSTGRFDNGTTNGTVLNDPQTYVGKRAAQLIQSGTFSNIRAAVNYILNSEAVPVVVGIFKNLDRDTFQLLSPDAGASLLARRNATSTTPKPSKYRNRTRTVNRKTNSTVIGRNSTTVKPTVLVNSTTTAKTGASRSTVDKKVVTVAVNNEDDEAESFEEEDDD